MLMMNIGSRYIQVKFSKSQEAFMKNYVVREVLISEQIKTGKDAGSWDPNDEWGRYGGRLYSTALATLTLEVYYRFLPLYRMNEKPELKIKVD